MNRTTKAVECFKKGFNCAQSVLVAFSDVVNLSDDMLLEMGSALGGGYARTRNLCGAVNAMGIIYGLATSCKDKAKAYDEMQDVIDKFLEAYKNVNCAELLKGIRLTKGVIPQERTDEYYQQRPCLKIVEDCVKLLEEKMRC